MTGLIYTMLESKFKPHAQKFFLNVVTSNAIARKVSPNTLTILSLLCGVAVLPALYVDATLTATILMVLSGYFDMLDGAMARAVDRTSALGTVYDIMSDRVVECAIVLGLVSVEPTVRALPALLMLSSMLICITSFLVVGIFTDNQSEKSFHYSVGLMERAEAFLFFMAMIWLPNHFTILALAFSVLVLLTGMHRIKQFSSHQRLMKRKL